MKRRSCQLSRGHRASQPAGEVPTCTLRCLSPAGRPRVQSAAPSSPLAWHQSETDSAPAPAPASSRQLTSQRARGSVTFSVQLRPPGTITPAAGGPRHQLPVKDAAMPTGTRSAKGTVSAPLCSRASLVPRCRERGQASSRTGTSPRSPPKTLFCRRRHMRGRESVHPAAPSC